MEGLLFQKERFKFFCTASRLSLYMKDNREEIIEKGLQVIGLASKSEKINYHSGSLFELYKVILDKDGTLVEIAAKVMNSAEMAKTELEGLKALAEENCIVPEVYGTYAEDSYAVLYMEFIPTGYIHDKGMGILQNMGSLYSSKKEKWGRDTDNFIGSLLQKNSLFDDFESYFWETRLAPMLQQAIQKGHIDSDVVGDTEKALARFSREWDLKHYEPRLIHGDLWNGNVIVGEEKVYFIDPSIAWGHPEQDMAMLNLFGSAVGQKDMEHLTVSLGMKPGLARRIPFWQLYPLLVHINIFGVSYVESYLRTLKLCL